MYKIKQRHTKHTTIYTMTKKWNQKNMKECDKRNSHTRSKLHMICLSSSNGRHPITKTFTTLHPTELHSTSLHLSTLHFFSFKLHPTTLHYPLIWLNSISISYRSSSPHITTLHLTSPHCTFRRFSPHFYSFHFTPFIIAFLTLFLKILGLQGKVPNASADSNLVGTNPTTRSHNDFQKFVSAVSLG